MDDFIKEYLFAWEKSFELTKREWDAGFIDPSNNGAVLRLNFHLCNMADLIKKGGVKNG